MSNTNDRRTQSEIAAYLEERAAFADRGDKDGVAAVDAELAARGYTRATAKKTASKERAVKTGTEQRGK